MGLNRADAWQLLTDYTKSESLLKHAMAVEAAVRGPHVASRAPE